MSHDDKKLLNETILALRCELGDARAGIEWRDAEIAVLKRTIESISREADRNAAIHLAKEVL